MSTEYALREALKMCRERGFETVFFTVRGKRIGYCTHCDYCLKHKKCAVRDDLDELYPLLVDAKGLIFATPVYNSGVSAQIKAIMDRCRALFAADIDVFNRKIGMAIAVGGDRSGGQELAIQQINSFYILNGTVPVGGGPFGANLGATFWSKDTLEGLKKDEEGFRSLKKTVMRFVDYLCRQ